MAKRTAIRKPIQHEALVKRGSIAAKGEAKGATLPLLDISLSDVKGTRVIQEGGRLRVLAEVGPDGLRGQRRYERVPVVRLNAKKIDAGLLRAQVNGYRPDGMATNVIPKPAKPTHQLPPRKGRDLDRGGTIFNIDDRRLFNDNAFPWRTTGKVNTEGKWGSGTTIGPRHVLTASHVVNWTGGPSGDVA